MKLQRWLSGCMALILWLGCLVLPAGASSEDLGTVIDQAARAERSLGGGTESGLLADQSVCPAGSNFCDWAAFAMARTGQDEDYAAYLKALEHYVTQQYMQEQNGVNGRHRIALTVLALGGDPTAFGTASDGSAINLVADATYAYAGDFTQETTNILAFALITLDAMDYAVPADAAYTRQELLAQLLARQTPTDGGFGLTAGSSDVDVTAMVIQALAPYQQEPEVKNATDQALAYLINAMDDQGTYTAYGTDSSESLCQVIIALCNLGIDPDRDGRFGSPTQTLLQYRCSDGGFRHALADEQGDFIATQQAMLALSAVERVRAGANGIYDLTDGSQGQNRGVPGWLVVVLAIAAAAVVVTVILRKKRGKNHV